MMYFSAVVCKKTLCGLTLSDVWSNIVRPFATEWFVLQTSCWMKMFEAVAGDKDKG